jgi:hypothetical protein
MPHSLCSQCLDIPPIWQISVFKVKCKNILNYLNNNEVAKLFIGGLQLKGKNQVSFFFLWKLRRPKLEQKENYAEIKCGINHETNNKK